MPSGTQPSDEVVAADARLAGLLRRGRSGDRNAYRAFLTELSDRLRRQMQARAPQQIDADVEDLVQEILISVHAYRATWDASKPVLPWVAAIARHRLADHLRRRNRADRHSAEMSRLAEAFSASRADETSDEVVTRMSMKSALEGLPETERSAFTLVRLRGLSLDEAAWFSGSTVAAVRVAVHRAAQKLEALVRKGRL